MFNFITDRSKTNLNRLKELSARGWDNMTTAEQAEWSGDPLTVGDYDGAIVVNLLPYGPYQSNTMSVEVKSDSIIATTTVESTNPSAIVVIGDATDFENSKITLSVESMYSSVGTPSLTLWWYDTGGSTPTGANLAVEGTLTYPLGENAEKRAFLALCVHIVADTTVAVGEKVRFGKVMVEKGAVNHPFVPYTEVVATPATKGAYNRSDLNRVERATNEIGELLGLSFETKTDWSLWDEPTRSDMRRYLKNVDSVLATYPGGTRLPFSTTKTTLTYSEANTIEQGLQKALVQANALYRTNEIFCGEV